MKDHMHALSVVAVLHIAPDLLQFLSVQMLFCGCFYHINMDLNVLGQEESTLMFKL